MRLYTVAGTSRAVRASRFVTESSSRMIRSPGPSRISTLYRRAPRSVRSSKYRTEYVCSSMASESVFTSVRNISISPHGPDEAGSTELLTCRGLRRAIVPGREPDSERCPAADGAFDGNRPVELFDDAFGDRQAKPKAAPFRRHELVEDRLQPFGRDARAGIGHTNLDAIAHTRCRHRDLAARLRRLNRVGDEVAEHAAEREAVAFDHQRPVGILRFDGDAVALAFGSHRLDDLGHRPVDVHREALDRLRFHDVVQVVEEPFDGRQLALDDAAGFLARLGIRVVAHQQARVVADVLDRMQQVVYEAGGDAAEHRLPLLALHILLQLDEAVRHGVERVAEISELVARLDVHS